MYQFLIKSFSIKAGAKGGKAGFAAAGGAGKFYKNYWLWLIFNQYLFYLINQKAGFKKGAKGGILLKSIYYEIR